MTPAALYWLFALAFTVHNIEEGLFLPAYTAAVPRLAGKVTPFAFRFALVALTGLLYGVVAFAAAGSRPAVVLLAGAAIVMVANAVIPHLMLTVAFRRYAPGTGTALGLMLPLSLLVVIDGFAAGLLTGRTLLVATITVAAAVVVAIPLLFWAGRRIERRLPWLSAGGAT